MQRVSTDRRDFMRAAGALAMASAASGLGIRAAGAQQVPYSSGTEAPKLQAPHAHL
jgi:hypothetical protein